MWSSPRTPKHRITYITIIGFLLWKATCLLCDFGAIKDCYKAWIYSFQFLVTLIALKDMLVYNLALNMIFHYRTLLPFSCIIIYCRFYNVYLFQTYICWCDKATFTEVTWPRNGSVFPWPLNHYVNWRKKKQVMDKLCALQWSKKTLDEVSSIYCEISDKKLHYYWPNLIFLL